LPRGGAAGKIAPAVTDALFTAAQRTLLEEAGRAPPDAARELLLHLAVAHWRAGEEAQFAECFRRAYLLDPSGQVMTRLRQAAGRTFDELRAMSDALARHAAAYAPVLAIRAVAEARHGNAEMVRALVDYDRFFRRGVCTPPDGMSRDAFNDALAQEIKADMVYYDNPANRSIRRGWRHNCVLDSETPAIMTLRRMLEAQVADYIAALPDDPDNLFLAMRPPRYLVQGWAVISDRETHHTSHLHPAAWATGVYYVTQPRVSRSSERGWLHVGPPRNAPFAAENGWESRLIEPARGSFVLMPAYFYHATEPMGVDEERICIAFEVVYPELRASSADY